MLPSCHRMRRSAEFATTVRAGRRAGRRTLVVHASGAGPAQVGGPAEPSRVGFVVSRRVGNAVVRNRTRRRLRHLIRGHLPDLGDGVLIVVRALPAAAAASSAQLDRDLTGALAGALQPLADRRSRESARAASTEGAAAIVRGSR